MKNYELSMEKIGGGAYPRVDLKTTDIEQAKKNAVRLSRLRKPSWRLGGGGAYLIHVTKRYSYMIWLTER